MSEEQVDIWNAMKVINREESQKRRASNRETSAAYLESKGIPYTTNNGGIHLMINFKGFRADIWPGTGKWAIHPTKTAGRMEGRGVRSLARFFETAK